MALTQVYWNRTRHVWSVRVSGLVVAYEPALVLVGCRLHAGESARQRCIREGARDVHSWVAGQIVDRPCPGTLVRIGYRLAEPSFRRRDTDEIITRADVVRFAPDGSAWALNPH